MGERADEIKREVEEARARLGQDLNELEYRVRSEFDWRNQFNRYPWAFVGAAFALAAAVGMLTGKSRSRKHEEAEDRLWIEREPLAASRRMGSRHTVARLGPFRIERECAPTAGPRSKAPIFR